MECRFQGIHNLFSGKIHTMTGTSYGKFSVKMPSCPPVKPQHHFRMTLCGAFGSITALSVSKCVICEIKLGVFCWILSRKRLYHYLCRGFGLLYPSVGQILVRHPYVLGVTRKRLNTELFSSYILTAHTFSDQKKS